MSATAKETQAAVDLLVEEGIIERTEDGEVLTEAQTDKAMAVDNWINDLGGHDDAAIVVYQVDPSSNKLEYIESLGVQEMTGPMLFEKLKNEYGGGKFRIQMRADGAIRKTQTVLIKKQPVKETEPGGIGFDLSSLVRELKTEQKDNSTELILNMIQSQNQQFQSMITTIVTAMGNNKSDAPAFDPVTMQASMLEGIQKMQELAGVNKPEKSPTDLILEGVKLVGAIRGDGEGGGEANMYSVLQKAIGEFGGTIGQAMSMQTPPLAPPQTAPALTDQTAPNKEAAPVGATLPEGHPLAPFEPFVDWMLGLAEKNANPELYAEVIIDQIGAEMAHAWLATDEGISALKENLPKTVPHENWLRLVGKEVVFILTETGGLPTTDGQPAIDPASIEGQNAVEPSTRTSDVRTGHDSPDVVPGIAADTASLDGDSERPGGDTDNPPIDGEFSESSQDDTENP